MAVAAEGLEQRARLQASRQRTGLTIGAQRSPQCAIDSKLRDERT
jgi:hypothetical protein